MNKFLALLLVLCTTIATMVAMGERTPWVPRETGLALPAAAAAPAPAPVPAPEIPAAATPVAAVTSAAPVLAPAVTTTTNSWVNAQTCGWVSGFSSSAWTCDEDWHCATNAEHVVGCVWGTYSPLFATCLDYSAWAVNSCVVFSADTNVGCCNHTTAPACGTYLWTGQPARSMYRCMTTASVVTMLDEPQFVLDSRTSSGSNSSSIGSPTATPSSSSSDDDADAEEKNTITVVFITVGTILVFFLILGMARLAAGFRWRCRGGDGGGDGGNIRGGESAIEPVDLSQQQQQHQQQQQQGRQV